MADLLLSALVSTVVGNLNTSALQEFGVAWGLGAELEKLKSTMSAIQSVLQDAEEKQWNSEAITNWLRKLKDVAYDADNVLDEFATEALMRKVEGEKGATSQVSSFFSLRNRLIFRMKMAHKLKNVRDRLDAISRERSDFHLREGAINMEVFDVKLDGRQTSSLVNESVIYGRDEEKKKIIEMLLTNLSDDQDNLAIYAIWGMGGLGKTTLAQLVYNDARVKSHFELRIWVCVSDDFQIRRLLRAIIESIDGSACNLSELDPLQKQLQEKLRGRKFLLALDDVWNENQEEWDRLKHTLMCGAKGSMLIVTTRIEKIALMMARVLPIHHIGCLSEDESWSLFKGRAFGLERVEERSELESIGKEIVKKCGGVPLAINALGSLVCSKRTKSEWLIVKDSQIWNLPKSENSILPALMLSYHHLSPHLRQCFAYCCVFPKDFELRMDKLIQLWMANGFIPSKGPSELYDFGVDIFNELVRRSFFQDVKEYPGCMTCKMHDLMHDLAQSIMRHECVAVESGKDVKVEGRIFHMFFVMISSQDISLNEDICKVRSLRSCIDAFDCEVSRPFLLRQKYLRVLDFKYVVQEVPRSISNLKHLRYLDMSGSNIKVLPKSTTCLLNLQTLKLDFCHDLCELPKGMKHMKSLMYLGIIGCNSLTCMPEGMGQLTFLQSLSFFIAGKKNGYQVSELKGLNLRNNLTIKELDNVRNSEEAKSANLIGKKNLHYLSLDWRSDNKSHVPDHVEDVLDGLQPHSNLKELSINNYHGSKIPTWIQDSILCDLVRISLDCWERCEHLPPLGKLPFLKVLHITGWHAVKYIGNEFHGDGAISFPSLKEFTLHKMRDLEEWRTMNGRENFPCQSTLDITDCPKLVEIPIIPSITDLTMSRNNAMLIRSVMNLTSLSSLVIEDMDDELTVLPDGLLQNHKMLEMLKISNMPNLKSLTNQLDNLSALNEFHLVCCDKIESLPEGLQNLHSLRELHIQGCNNLLSLPMNGLQGLSSLRSLHIGSCNKFCSLSEGIQYLIALEDLYIDSCPKLISLPEGLQHLTALRYLKIVNCEDLSSLPKQIGCLTSLSFLGILNCPNLTSIPDEIQNLTALKSLRIGECPHLEKRCKKDSGEDWHKISHIPHVDIISYSEIPSSTGP
ncbi:disease resistance protein RGA2-like [Quercus lobata]|uniref:Uncharacterized protein n=1 Tax=Quercus lobata TaxID=97700 RepID=A0A7N2RCY3_QUELO|nr:disease resistance protein RGA2-like [Quercus lobata]